jgi:hypothetical protein
VPAAAKVAVRPPSSNRAIRKPRTDFAGQKNDPASQIVQFVQIPFVGRRKCIEERRGFSCFLAFEALANLIGFA